MKCADVISRAALYLSGELDSARAGEIQAHLVSCGSCCRELALQAELDARLRNHVFAADVNSSTAILDQRIRLTLAEFELKSHAEQSAKTSGSRSWMNSWRWLVAVGCAAGIAAVAIVTHRAFQIRQVDPVCADAALDHQREVVEQQSRVWVSDRSAIDSLAGRFGVPVASVSALVDPGHRLERAKLCRLAGRIYMHLVFIDGGREVSVFLGPNDGHLLDGPVREKVNATALHSEVSGQERVASFQTSQLTALVVSDQSGESAMRFARFAARVL